MRLTTTPSGKPADITKYLLDKPALKPIRQATSAIKSCHEHYTSPWDANHRIGANENHMEFMPKMSALTSKFDDAADQLVVVYPSLLREAESGLGDLFDRKEYPAISEIRSKFWVEFTIDPVNESGDFRATVADDEVDRLKADLERRNDVKIARAMNNSWTRLYDVVKSMAERFEKSKDNQFHDSIVGNITRLTSILPALNITKDPKLEEMRKEIEQRLCGNSGRALREDDTVRTKTYEATQDIMKRMEKVVGGVK